MRWFHKVDDELPMLLSYGQSPVVLAGVDYLFSLYHEASSYAYLLDQGIPGNPEELKPDELNARAWPLVEPIFLQAQENVAALYKQQAGTEQTRTDVIVAVQAAHHGSVDALFVVVGVQVLGKYEPETDVIARMGGDEFAILLPETEVKEAQELIDRVQVELNNEMMRAKLPVSFSIGVITVQDVGEMTVDKLISEVDLLMYQAKQSEKNSICYKLFPD